MDAARGRWETRSLAGGAMVLMSTRAACVLQVMKARQSKRKRKKNIILYDDSSSLADVVRCTRWINTLLTYATGVAAPARLVRVRTRSDPPTYTLFGSVALSAWGSCGSTDSSLMYEPFVLSRSVKNTRPSASKRSCTCKNRAREIHREIQRPAVIRLRERVARLT